MKTSTFQAYVTFQYDSHSYKATVTSIDQLGDYIMTEDALGNDLTITEITGLDDEFCFCIAQVFRGYVAKDEYDRLREIKREIMASYNITAKF